MGAETGNNASHLRMSIIYTNLSFIVEQQIQFNSGWVEKNIMLDQRMHFRIVSYSCWFIFYLCTSYCKFVANFQLTSCLTFH